MSGSKCFSSLINEDLPFYASQTMLGDRPQSDIRVFYIIPGDTRVKKEEGEVVAMTQFQTEAQVCLK